MPLSRNLGTLTSWNPLGHSGPVTGLLYFYYEVGTERSQLVCGDKCARRFPSLPTLEFPSVPFSLYRPAHIVFASEGYHVTITTTICVKRRVEGNIGWGYVVGRVGVLCRERRNGWRHGGARSMLLQSVAAT